MEGGLKSHFDLSIKAKGTPKEAHVAKTITCLTRPKEKRHRHRVKDEQLHIPAKTIQNREKSQSIGKSPNGGQGTRSPSRTVTRLNEMTSGKDKNRGAKKVRCVLTLNSNNLKSPGNKGPPTTPKNKGRQVKKYTS